MDKDSSYVDHKDFDNNSENNEFSDPDADEMVLGDERYKAILLNKSASSKRKT